MPLPMFKKPMGSLGVPEEPQMSNPMVMNREPQMSEPTPFQAPQINPSMPVMNNSRPVMNSPVMNNTPQIMGGRQPMKRPIIRPSLGGLRPPNRFGAGRPY